MIFGLNLLHPQTFHKVVKEWPKREQENNINGRDIDDEVFCLKVGKGGQTEQLLGQDKVRLQMTELCGTALYGTALLCTLLQVDKSD